MGLQKLNRNIILCTFAALIAFSSNAISSDARTVTACFQVVHLQNISNTSFYMPAITDAASTANGLIFGLPQIKYLKSVPSEEVDDCFGTQRFCCAVFTEASAGTPATVPIIIIGGIPARWVVTSVQFHQ